MTVRGLTDVVTDIASTPGFLLLAFLLAAPIRKGGYIICRIFLSPLSLSPLYIYLSYFLSISKYLPLVFEAIPVGMMVISESPISEGPGTISGTAGTGIGTCSAVIEGLVGVRIENISLCPLSLLSLYLTIYLSLIIYLLYLLQCRLG